MSVEARTLFALPDASGLRKVGIVVGAIAAFCAGVWALTPVGGESLEWFLMVPVGALFLSIAAVCHVSMATQLFARAVHWSNLGLGVILCILGSHKERDRGVVLAVACALALMVAGRVGLREAERRAAFVPAAFKSSLLLLMVLALADAQTFFLLGGASLSDHQRRFAFVLFAAALVMIVGFVLLMRLSLVGLFANVGTCILVFAYAALHTGAHKSFPEIMMVLTGLHALAASPTLYAVLTRRPVPGLGPRGRAIGATAVLIGSMVGSIGCWAFRL
jgi:uncharacterized membrane protein (UPF0136 family)